MYLVCVPAHSKSVAIHWCLVSRSALYLIIVILLLFKALSLLFVVIFNLRFFSYCLLFLLCSYPLLLFLVVIIELFHLLIVYCFYKPFYVSYCLLLLLECVAFYCFLLLCTRYKALSVPVVKFTTKTIG